MFCINFYWLKSSLELLNYLSVIVRANPCQMLLGQMGCICVSNVLNLLETLSKTCIKDFGTNVKMWATLPEILCFVVYAFGPMMDYTPEGLSKIVGVSRFCISLTSKRYSCQQPSPDLETLSIEPWTSSAFFIFLIFIDVQW